MCTLSWHYDDTGFSVFFNRDELKTRGRAEYPRIVSKNGFNVVYPTDPDRGGTWIAATERGEVICLLNDYSLGLGDTHRAPRSRGALVVKMAFDSADQDPFESVEEDTLMDYGPFRCFHLTSKEIRSLYWDGDRFFRREHDRAERPISGSSFKNDEVVSRRLKKYDEMMISEGSSRREKRLESYHFSLNETEPAYGVNMERDDARTVSFTKIDRRSEELVFNYRPKNSERLWEFEGEETLNLPISKGYYM